MKKILLFLVALAATLSMNAQTTEIHNASGKVASYLGADVTVKFGVAGDGQPTLEVYKGGELQKTYTGSEYKVVSTPVEETFKAVYNTNGGANTLTFYYDADDHSGNGITVYQDGTDKYLFDNAQSEGAKWGYNDVRENVSKVAIDESVKKYSSLTSTAYMFMYMLNATGISGAEYLDVSNVTDMSEMFSSYGYNTKDFNTVPNVSGWNTGNVKNMAKMFYRYGYRSASLTVVPDVSGWKTGNVTNMDSLFLSYGCLSTSLAVVPNVSKWNTGNVKNMANMFGRYGYMSASLNAVPDVSNWNTGNVTDMSGMFNTYGYASKNISCELDLSGWDLSKIEEDKGANVFNFKPKTFDVTIPGKTGDKVNEESNWYYGNGTNHIAPPSGMSFTIFGQGYAAVKAEAGVTDNKVKWVQLWEGGPKFAEYNVGVENNKPEDYGCLYGWGGTQDKNENDYNKGSVPLTGDYDTATNLWGSNWRMPTEEELRALLQVNCTCTWTEHYNGSSVSGLLCTGKGAYSSNSIFLPAAGLFTVVPLSQNVKGYYWSSTPNDENSSVGICFNSEEDISFEDLNRKYGRSVRAVLKDPVAVTGVSLNKTELKVGKGNTETLSATVTPADATNKKVLWTSSDEKVATVDAYGKVTGVASGKCNITATTEDGGKTAICAVEVVVLSPAGSIGKAKRTGNIDVNWVQLWKGGPKFATYNVGVTDGNAESYGGKYTWSNNIAENNWGDNWRMPTKEELEALLSSCDVELIDGSNKKYNGTDAKGLLCTGQGDYASNSIFLPAALTSSGAYWSSTPSATGDKSAIRLAFNLSTKNKSVSDAARSMTYSVRAVLK